MCSITPETAKVGSSYSNIRGPGIGCWFSDRSNGSQWNFEAAVLPINPYIYTDQWEPIVIYHAITLLVFIQLCSPRRWHLDSNYCRTRYRQSQPRSVLSPLALLLRLLGTFQSDISLFTLTWQLSTVLYGFPGDLISTKHYGSGTEQKYEGNLSSGREWRFLLNHNFPLKTEILEK